MRFTWVLTLKFIIAALDNLRKKNAPLIYDLAVLEDDGGSW